MDASVKYLSIAQLVMQYLHTCFQVYACILSNNNSKTIVVGMHIIVFGNMQYEANMFIIFVLQTTVFFSSI